MDFTHYIGGQWQAGTSKAWQTYDPCTGQAVWQGQQASPKQLAQAIVAAQQGFSQWARTPLDERVQAIKQFSTILTEQTEMVATTIALETGKPYWEAKQEVSAMVNKIDLSIQAYHERCHAFHADQAGTTLNLQHKPHGLMVVLGPYNFPGHLPNGHIIPALLAGNAVIFKPSELTPQTAIAMTKLWEHCSLPAGVFQLLQGDGKLGETLAVHEGISGVLFTGSYTTGQTLHRALAGQVSKLLVLEMGGNNPLIVWDEPSIPEAVANILVSAFITTGQRCTAARRLILPTGYYSERLLDALIAGAKALSRGEPMKKPEVFMGPLISVQARNRIFSALESKRKQGVTALLAAQSPQDSTGWISPGIYLDKDGCLPDSEIFGPILVIQYAEDFNQAIALANATKFGLSAGLISPNQHHWQDFAAKSQAGILAWNKPLTGASSRLPFGGTGHSGNARPSAWYAADYSAYPVAAQSAETLVFPTNVPEGLLP